MSARLASSGAALILVALLHVPLGADYIEVKRSVTLKAAPQGNAEILENLSPGDTLELVQGSQENGYYRARLRDSGTEGWVYRTFVRRHAGSIPGETPPSPTPPAPNPIADGVWVKFDHDFVEAHYKTDVAFSSVTFDTEWKASTRHQSSCGGKDGEIHIGAYESSIEFPSAQQPFSRLVDEPTVAWGIVVEPPNAIVDDSDALSHLQNERVTFTGYMRVWNEGHYDDETKKKPGGSSNPNHLLELHPAWRLVSDDDEFEEYDFQKTSPMDNYAGYGLSKVVPMLQEISAGQWPQARNVGGQLHLFIGHESNFFQLPVRITAVEAQGEGLLMRADVCAAVGCSGNQFLFRNLRLVTRNESQPAKPFAVGDVTELLGVFSVHLGRAMRQAAASPQAVSVADALEFFVFARAAKPAVRNSKCEPE